MLVEKTLQRLREIAKIEQSQKENINIEEDIQSDEKNQESIEESIESKEK